MLSHVIVPICESFRVSGGLRMNFYDWLLKGCTALVVVVFFFPFRLLLPAGFVWVLEKGCWS